MCQAPPRRLCDSCFEGFQAEPEWTWLDAIPFCTSGVPSSTLLPVLRAFKDESRTGLAVELSRLIEPALAEVCRRFPDVDAFVVPPSPMSSWRKRGFNPVNLILTRAGLSALPALRRMRGRTDQRGLSLAQRAENMSGTLRALPTIRGRCVIIVDDIVTTGATVGEAARAIVAAGGIVCAIVALARVPLRSDALPASTRRKKIDDNDSVQA